MSSNLTKLPPPAASQLTFYDRQTPALESGTYTLGLTQTLEGLTPALVGSAPNGTVDNPTFNQSYTFFVAAERFRLGPGEIHKLFPPPNSQGDFDSVLPHVVLKRPTLPWERTADSPPPAVTGQDATSPLPWLAVLVFGKGEAPTINTGTVADLVPIVPNSKTGGLLPASHYSYGSVPSTAKFLEPGQALTNACRWIDVVLPSFYAWAPSATDLAWNTHARERAHRYAVVVANRLPPAGQTVVAHLVSLEGLAAILPLDDGTPPATTPLLAGFSYVRLVSLKSWSFRVGPLQESFVDIAQGLNGGGAGSQQLDSQLRLPTGYRPAKTTATPTTPFDSGYTVLCGPDLSNTDKTVESWYRGPLVPSVVVPPAADSTWPLLGKIPADKPSSLDVTRAPATPSHDLSYSAAWQIGRMIALADRAFATEQVAWKRECRRKLNVALGHSGSTTRATFARSLGSALASPTDILTYLCPPAPPNLPKPPSPIGLLTTDRSSTDGLYIPSGLIEWLAKLAALQSVPFCYLVPDATMLPPEAIRFFRVDPRWLACLLDGAWSLGREPAAMWAFDTVFQPWKQLLTGSFSLPSPLAWPVGGLLLNSRIVPDYWPGVLIETDKGTVVREDRLGPNTILALFDAMPTTVTLREPPEGVHFGFTLSATGVVTKSLGSPVVSIPVPQRGPGVIQLGSLADKIKTTPGVEPTSGFGSSALAKNLIAHVGDVTFTLPPIQS